MTNTATFALFRRAPAVLAACFILAGSPPAAALPAFAAQTGLPCAACHDGFPQLTPLGRRFKLDGYVMGGSYPLAENIAAMVQAGYTQLHAKVPGGLAPDYSSNNGLARNFAGSGRSAQDNNTFFTGAWLAF